MIHSAFMAKAVRTFIVYIVYVLLSCSANMHVADNSSFYFCYQMNKDKSKSSNSAPTDTKGNKVGQLFPNASLEDYAKLNRVNVGHDDGEICDDSEGEVCEDEDDNSDNEDCDEDGNSDDEDGDSENEDCDENDDKNDENTPDHTSANHE